MAAPSPQLPITTPPDVAKTPATEPLIFTMPPEYRGGATGKKLVEPTKEAPKPVVAVPQKTIVPPPPPTAKPIPPPKKKSNFSKLLIIGGLLFVVLLGSGGYALVYFAQPSEPEEEPVVRPTTKPPEENPSEETPEEEPTPSEENPEEPFPVASTSGTDGDSDGLTDIEENVVYRTDPRLPDTDKDGFLDGNEVFHRYNPSGLAPGTLLESGVVKEYAGMEYTIMYPSVWAVQADTEGRVAFATTTGEAFTVSAEAKPATQTLEDWYDAQDPEGTPISTTTKNGYPMLITQNKLTAYLDDGERVLVLSYATGIKSTIEYLQTFQMMVNSIVLP